MKILKWPLIIVCILISCKRSQKNFAKVTFSNQDSTHIQVAKSVDSIHYPDYAIKIKPQEVSYSISKSKVASLRISLKKQFINQSITLDSVQSFFTENLLNTIIPYWYSTPWSFEGHTATPNQGEIACGYFVSTTLRDMGLKLNRYKLAQKSPINEAKVLSYGSKIYTIDKDPVNAILEINKITSEGFYFIGFDASHVGYLLKRKGKLFLIHSNYLSPTAVCIEPIEQSEVFKSYSKFYITSISNNELLIRNWLRHF